MSAGDAGPAPHPDPVDWATARRVAGLVAGRDAIADSYLGTSLGRDFAAVTAEAEALVADHTGLRAPDAAEARVLERRAWIDANVGSMQRMLAPVTERLGRRAPTGAAGRVGRHVAGTEVGVLLGFLAQRVLGQYDLLVAGGEGDASADAVYYVGPNILALEKRFAFRPLEFRRWIALHECTHRAQFTAVPWMRDYFLGLVEESMALVDPDPRTLAVVARRAADAVRAGRNPLDDGGIVGLFASPEQRRILERVQALMSLLEGHGNVVMDDLGRRCVTGAERMAEVLHSRRNRRGLGGLVFKLMGLEMKMRQYEAGERFVRGVTSLAGDGAIDRAWRSCDDLPTLPELDDPSAWLARTDAGLGRADAPPAATTGS